MNHTIELSIVKGKVDQSAFYGLTPKGERVKMTGIRVVRIEKVRRQGLMEIVKLTYDDNNGTAKVENFGKFERLTWWQKAKREIKETTALARKVYDTLRRSSGDAK